MRAGLLHDVLSISGLGFDGRHIMEDILGRTTSGVEWEEKEVAGVFDGPVMATNSNVCYRRS